MSFCSFSAGATGRPAATASLQRRARRTILGLACVFAAVLLIVAPGCTNRRRSVETAEVSGQVLVDGQPLPGGLITFVTKDGFPANGVIDEKGNYKLKAPVGEVSIGVDNSALRTKRGAPKNIPHPKGPPGSENADDSGGVKGTWVNIPLRYADPSTSGLKYTVTSGAQTHKVELSSKILPPSGSSGQ